MTQILTSMRLEFNNIKQNKISIELFLIAPLIIIYIFFILGNMEVPNIEKGIRIYDFYMPILLAVLIMFVTLQISIMRIVTERSPYGTLERDLLAIDKPSLYIGKFLLNGLVVLILTILIAIEIVYIFPVSILGNSFLIFVYLFLLGLCGISFGLFFSVITKSKEIAVQLVPYIVLLFFTLIAIPISVIPEYLEKYFTLLPVNAVFKGIMLVIFSEGFNIAKGYGITLLLILWVFGLLILGILKFVLEKPISIQKDWIEILLLSVIFVGLLLSFLLIHPNWESMQIDDFKVYELQSPISTLPHIHDVKEWEYYSIIKDYVLESKLYLWQFNINGENTPLAGVMIAKLSNTEPLDELNYNVLLKEPSLKQLLEGYGINENEIDFQTKKVLGQEIVLAKKKYQAEGRTYNIEVNLWHKNKFVFVVAGDDTIVNRATKWIIKHYPQMYDDRYTVSTLSRI